MKWQNLETAPSDGTVVLLVGRGMRHADGYFERGSYSGNGAWIWPYVHCNPTHWMPLPSAPEQAHNVSCASRDKTK